MGSAYEAWVTHRLKCERCWAWHCAEPDATRCKFGVKLYEQMVKGA